ncbi:MAG: hypothetical protein JNM59_00955 [Hyphomonadaceae bacterium]|nr:hypothetical protein [Hyphomonadaceae bacterium]
MFRTLAFIAIALGACAPAPAPSLEGCRLNATHNVTWSNTSAQDVVTARADGPTCAQAVVNFTVRNANGDPLWTFASTYYDMTIGGAPPPNTSAPTDAEVGAFLNGWANVEVTRSSDLPSWSEGAASLSESASTFSYDTAFDREAYEALRARGSPMLCFAAAAEAVRCLVIAPLSNAPTEIVAYGP